MSRLLTVFRPSRHNSWIWRVISYIYCTKSTDLHLKLNTLDQIIILVNFDSVIRLVKIIVTPSSTAHSSRPRLQLTNHAPKIDVPDLIRSHLTTFPFSHLLAIMTSAIMYRRADYLFVSVDFNFQRFSVNVIYIDYFFAQWDTTTTIIIWLF